MVAEEGDVGAGEAAEFGHFGAVADNDQAAVGHLGEGFDDQVDAFVGDQAGGGEVEILLVVADGEGVDVDRGVDDLGVTAVDLFYAAGDVGGVGDEFVDAVGGADVPLADIVQDEAGEGAFNALGQAGLAQIFVLHVPGVADGRVAVADMGLIRAGEDAFGDGVAAGDDEVVAGHVELLDGDGHEREVSAVFCAGAGEALDEGGFRALAKKFGAVLVGEEIADGE